MAAISSLKKKLRSIRATRKLSKALKTVSAVKYSRLSEMVKNYRNYPQEFRFLYEAETGTDGTMRDAEDIQLVLGSNQGFCGGFNYELSSYVTQNAPEPTVRIACGKECIRVLTENGTKVDYPMPLPDVPRMEDCEELILLLEQIAGERENVSIRIIRPFYRNMMTQTPGEEWLFLNPHQRTLRLEEEYLWMPDMATVLASLYEKGFHARVYGAVLETALGAQAAMLMAMRSAYDTAVEYCGALEKEIQKLRQSAVTEDVIETSSEHAGKGEESYG